MVSSKKNRVFMSAAALIIAGIGFVLYPALRPFSDEISLEGAAAFGSSAWILAHMIAMVSFTLLLPGLFSVYEVLRGLKVERDAYWAWIAAMTGIGLTLPFYGGEAYGLHAVGMEAVRQGNAALLDLATTIRSGPGLIMFVIALLLLAAGSIMFAVAFWRSGKFSKWSGVPLALGFALYLPQFFGNQPIRVAHGVLVALGCFWLAGLLWSSRKAAATAV
ncbi:MAG: hypothetical protein P8X64_05695 [Anaerolineales bacterium]